MRELILGLVAFAGFALLWVVVPHRVIRRHQMGSDGPQVHGEVSAGPRVPLYWFDATGSPAVPVFARPGAYVARVRGGPEIAGPTLTDVREKLSAYLERTDLRVLPGEAAAPVAHHER